MSDLYLKVTNDIKEDVVLCYIYSNTGACYGLKYSPNNTNQLSIVVLNSRQTEVETEQTGAENHKLSKDDLIHIYTDSSQGLGVFFVSSIHNGIESNYPSPFVLQAKDGYGRVDFDNEPFSFAGIKVNNFSEFSNSITEISSYEYESKVNSSESSSINATNLEESKTETEVLSSVVTNSTATTISTSSTPLNEKSNGKMITWIVIAIAIIAAVFFVFIKFNVMNKLLKILKETQHNHTSNRKSQALISANYVECSIINQSNCPENKKLLAHSLFNEDFEMNMDVKLAIYSDFTYYRDQNASKIKYQKTYSSTNIPNTPFIISITHDWKLVIAKHNNSESITLNIFDINYINKTKMDINEIYKFLSNNIKGFVYDSNETNTPASCFFRLLNKLMEAYKKKDYGRDSRIKSISDKFSQNKSIWNDFFKEQMPAQIYDAIVIISELFFMKKFNVNNSNKWERLIDELRSIKDEIDNRIKIENEKTLSYDSTTALVQPSPSVNNQNYFSNENVVSHAISSSSDSQSQFGAIQTEDAPISKPVQQSVRIIQPTGNYNDVITMYKDASRYFNSKIPPDFCKPASDVTAYHIATPYKLTMISNKSRPAIPEFILIGINLYPNPFRFKNGIIKGDDINRIILDEVYEINRTYTGTISQITPAKVDLSNMTVIEKGKIIFVD